jgi:hypothetical protein
MLAERISLTNIQATAASHSEPFNDVVQVADDNTLSFLIWSDISPSRPPQPPTVRFLTFWQYNELRIRLPAKPARGRLTTGTPVDHLAEQSAINARSPVPERPGYPEPSGTMNASNESNILPPGGSLLTSPGHQAGRRGCHSPLPHRPVPRAGQYNELTPTASLLEVV